MNNNLPANTNLDTPQADPAAEPTGIPSLSAHPFPQKVQKNILLLLPIVLLLFAGIALVLLSQQKTQDVRSRAAAGGTTLAMAPAAKTAAVGESFAVGVTMNTGMDTVSAAKLHLSYDPAALDIVGFTPGTALPVVLVPENHTNGVLSVTLGASPTSPFKGADIVGTWTMKVRAAKQSSLQFTNATAVAALGKTANTLAGASGSTIIGAVGTNPCAGAQDGATCTDTCARACAPNAENCIDLCTTRKGVCVNQECETWLTPAPTYTPRVTPAPVYRHWWQTVWSWLRSRAWWRR